MKLFEILPHLQSTYKSVEIDIACVLHEDKWQNFMTLVRFTDEDPIEANERISRDGKLQKLKNGKIFRIYKKYFAIDSLPVITKHFQKGIKIIDGDTISYFEPVDLMNYDLSYYRLDPSNDTNFGSYTTFSQASHDLKNKLYPIGERARGEMVPLGYEDIFDAIRRVFQPDFVPESTSYIVVKLPVFAKINNVEMDKEKIRILCRYHKKLGGLFLRYGMKNFPEIEPISFDQSKGKFDEEGDFEIWKLEVDSVPLDQSRDDIWCDINLFFQPLATDVSYFTKRFSEMIAEKKLLDANPLAKIFSKFCSMNELQKMFSEAEIRRSKLDVSDHFERTVSWLFALHGFQSIWLGNDLQVTRSSESINLGSADVLCYSSSKKTMAIVSCKIGQIQDNAIDGIKNLSKTIEEELKEFEIEVNPIIVSAKAADAVKQKAKGHGVHVIDGNDLKIILQKLYEGPARPDLLLKPSNNEATFQNFNIHY